jgi:hypothetical protein
VEVSRTSPERVGEKVPPAFRHYFVRRASPEAAYRPVPPLNLSPPASTLFPANSYLLIECVRSPVKRIISGKKADPPGSRTSRYWAPEPPHRSNVGCCNGAPARWVL